MSYKTYPEYKNSNNIWAGKIPIHWEIHKIKNLIFFQEGPGLRNWQFTDDGVRVICVTNITSNGIDFSNYEKFISEDEYKQTYSHFTVDQGDLLLSSSGNSWGKVAEYTDDETVILNTSTIRINKNPTSDYELKQPYIKWALQSEYIREQLGLMMTGSCQPNFGPTHLAKVSILMPTIKEQQQIANYLDKKTDKIEETIAKNKQLIELLEEKRTALINQVVTKGLNPNVLMKDSGVEWIGEIPEHWEITKVKHELDILDHKRVPLSAEVRSDMDRIYDYYGASGIIDKVDSYLFDGKYILVGEDGANLLSRSTPLAFIAEGKFWVNNHAHILSPKYGNNIDYFVSLLEATDYTPFIEGSAQPKLTADNLKNIILIKPPLLEQNEIAIFLNSQLTHIHETLSKIKNNINLLEEYKTSLIHHVVTGKIDVRGEEI